MKIFGHKQQRESLRRLLNSGRLPASVIFSGVAGTGKLLVARELARSMICETAGEPAQSAYGGCGQCRSCRLFDSGNFPDFHLVQCLDRETWSVSAIRELLYALNLRAFSGSYRVVIFNDAENLSLQAANALLKTLEEPGSRTHFILVTSNHSRLPQTILSRCQIWFFDTLAAEDIKAALMQRIEDGEEDAQVLKRVSFDEVALLADGSLEGISHILKDLDFWQVIKQTLDNVHHGDLEKGFALARDLGKDKDRLRRRLNLMRICARKKMQESQEAAERSRWAIFLSNILYTERLVFERNISAAYALNVSFLDLAAGPPLNSFTTLTNSATLLERIIV